MGENNANVYFDTCPRESLNFTIPHVPEVFLQENFDLSNLETFNEVICAIDKNTGQINDRQNIRCHDGLVFRAHQEGAKPPKILTKEHLSQLQQSFTDYLDVIEEKLSSRISNRSGDFFQVMSSVHSVLDELSLAIKSVTSLRGKCSILSASLIEPNLRKINLTKTRTNEKLVLDKLTQISHLYKIQPRIQLLLSASDFVGALDLIAKARVLLHKDFKKVSCLMHLESELVEVERMAGTMIQREFECRIKESNFEKLLATEFNNLSKLVENFSNGFSDICERNSLNLLSLLQRQTEEFVNKFHGERKRRVELCLDIEQWKMVEEVPDDIQRMITHLVDEHKTISDLILLEEQNLVSDYKKLVGSKHLDISSQFDSSTNAKMIPCEPGSSSTNNILQPNSQSPISNLTKRERNLIKANGTSFVIVNSVIILLHTVMDYCKCCQEIRPLSKELMGCLLQILQLFNNKTFALVNKAGALAKEASGGLKNITARSLILSQRSLKLIILIMPALHEHFARILVDDDRLRRFDEIKFNYEDHAAQVPGRIVYLVRDVIEAALRDWEAKPPVPSAQFTEISQHLVRLHDNIQDALPTKELKLLFFQIHNTFEESLYTHLLRLDIRSDAGPKQLLVRQELALFKASIIKLSVYKNWDINYDNLWGQLRARVSDQNNPNQHQKQSMNTNQATIDTTQ